MTFQPFKIEQYLSDHEQSVAYNFAESGVHPATLGELLILAGRDANSLVDIPLNYPEVNGLRELRARIAERYPGAGPDNVLVTVGASEANLLAATTLLAPGDEIVTTRPTYLQFAGIAANLGVQVRTVDLIETQGWALDVAALDEVITPRTRVVAVVNPNNPTGKIFTADERAALVAAAERVGAWLLVDEVYAGAERDGDAPETATLYGDYDRVIALNGLSKAYGLPGLRIGWMVGPEQTIADLWRRHEYAVVSTTMLGNHLALMALDANVRPQLIQRTRRLVRDGFATLQACLNRHPGVFTVVPPRASALSFVGYDLPLTSREFSERLRRDHSVLTVPGDCFGLEGHLRISSALPGDYLQAGLAALSAVVAELQSA